MTPNEIEHLASQLVALSREAEAANDLQKEDQLLRMAAELELGSPELQNCWGGPLNGQEGRRAIFHELIEVLGFDAILETGTYRGLTTAWFADRFNGPIHSCEVDRRYHYQAVANLRARESVYLSLEDSRHFLRRVLPSLSASGRYFAYLDAHWHDDLPLEEEVGIILESGREFVIAIDDFKVPGQDYQYDNYGIGKVISLELLRKFEDPSIRYFFPRLPASHETGAARGVCIIARGLAPALRQCKLLEDKSWGEWRAIETAHEAMRRTLEEEVREASDRKAAAVAVEATLSTLDGLDGVKFGMRSLLQSQESLHQVVEDFMLSLGERLEAIDDRREMGRMLVEQRAKNLELERQLFRLKEELSASSAATATSRDGDCISPAKIAEVRRIADSLARSRAINALSVVAPNARRTVDMLVERLAHLTDGSR